MPKQTKQITADNVDFFTIASIGAGQGIILRGIDATEAKYLDATKTALKSVDGARLRVVRGTINPHAHRVQECHTLLGDDRWAQKLAKQIRTTPPKAQLVLQQHMQHATTPHLLLGCSTTSLSDDVDAHTATFVIESCAESWTDEVLREKASQGVEVTGQELAQLFHDAQNRDGLHPGFLTLRSSLWVQADAAHEVSLADFAAQKLVADISFSKIMRDPDVRCAMYKVPIDIQVPVDGNHDRTRRLQTNVHLYVPRPRAAPMTLGECTTLVMEDDTLGTNEDKTKCFDYLTNGSIGQSEMKSIAQKILRFLPESVRLPDGSTVSARTLMACTIAVCFSPRGNMFNPELAKYILGQTAILKRLAVIIIEDGGNLRAVPALLAVATATSVMPGYHASEHVLRWAIDVSTSPAKFFHGVLAWRDPREFAANVQAGLISKSTVVFPEHKVKEFKIAAYLLRVIRTFEGDERMMFDTAALIAKDHTKVPVIHSGTRDDPSSWMLTGVVMPIEHIYDQHVTRGIGFVTAAMDRDALRKGIEKRYRQVWEECSGFNPRMRGVKLDESKPAVREVRAAQGLIVAEAFGRSPQSWSNGNTTTCRVNVNRGELAAGVGIIKCLKVTTLIKENQADGMANPTACLKWNVVACLGTEKDEIVAMHAPTAHKEGVQKKRPEITRTVQQRVSSMVHMVAKTDGLPFNSVAFPKYNRVYLMSVHLTSGKVEQWVLRGPGMPDIIWDYSSSSTSLTFDKFALPELTYDPLAYDDADSEAMLDATTYSGQSGIVQSIAYAQRVVKAILQRLSPAMRRRLSGLLTRESGVIRMSVPVLKGNKIGSDQFDVAVHGDWHIYRALCIISRIMPAAFSPTNAPNFKINDARLIRIIDQWLKRTFAVDSDKERMRKANWTTRHDFLTAQMQRTGIDFFDYQKQLLQTMHERDLDVNYATRGHLVSLDVGLGKTLLGIAYLIQYLAKHGAGMRIFWFTTANVVPSHIEEFTKKFGIAGVRQLNKLSDLKESFYVGVIAYETLQAPGEAISPFTEELVRQAPQTVVCFDELHKLYGVGVKRNSGALRIATACPKFVALTATPVASKAQKLAGVWLAMCSPFEVNDKNMMVAASRLISARVHLDIERIDHVEMEQIDSALRIQSLNAAKAGTYTLAFSIVRQAMLPKMADRAIVLAVADRVKNPGGGCFLVANDRNDASAMIDRINSISQQLGFCARMQGERNGDKCSDTDPTVGVVVQVIHKDVGYNLDRLGVMLTSVYAANPSKRYQMRGRLYRATQKRKAISYYVMVPEHTVASLMFERQSRDDSKADSIKDLGPEFLRLTMQQGAGSSSSASSGGKRKANAN